MVSTKTHDKLIKPVLYYEPGKFRLFVFFFLPMRPRILKTARLLLNNRLINKTKKSSFICIADIFCCFCL